MTGFMLFFTAVLLIYFSANLYVLVRLTSLLSIHRGWGFYLLLIGMTASYFAAAAIQSVWWNGLTRLFYVGAGIWIGMLFWLLCLLLIHDALRIVRVPIPRRAAGVFILTAAVLITGYAFYNARRIIVWRIPIEAPVSLKLVQLTDIHLGSISPEQFSGMIDKANSLEPDIICITGDLLDSLNPTIREALKQLDRLAAPILFISGNHERYAGLQRVEEALKDIDVRFLRNETYELKGVQFIGLDDNTEKEYLSESLSKLPLRDDRYKILLFHRPDHPETIVDKGIDLMLCGHTHNGQIFPFNYIVKRKHKYMYGLYQFGAMKMYVSCGTGYWGSPLRLGSQPEITVFELGPKAD